MQHIHKLSSPILLILAIIIVYCSYYGILDYHLLSAIFLTAFTIIILIEGWSISGSNNPQSLVYLSDNNWLEFIIRVLLIIVSLYIVFFVNGNLSMPYCGILLIVILCYNLSIDLDNETSLANIWQESKIRFAIIAIALIVYFAVLYI